GCIPDKLAHERGQLRLNGLQFTQDRPVRGLLTKEGDLADALSGRREQRGRGGKVVLLGKGLRSLAPIKRRSHVHAVRVLQDVVEPGGRLRVRRRRGGASRCRSCPGARTSEWR